jgi:hypothetical protein
MPNKAQHLAKAEHNEKFALALNSDKSYSDYRDWVVTAYFYSALHLVEAYFAIQGKHSGDHRARSTDIQADPFLQKIYDEYRELQDDSTNARYDTYMPTPFDVSHYTRPNHEQIKVHVLSAL